MERERYLKEKIILFYSDVKDSGQRFEREIFEGKQIILFYSDVKGFHRDISTKDSRAAWDELLAKIGEAGDAF